MGNQPKLRDVFRDGPLIVVGILFSPRFLPIFVFFIFLNFFLINDGCFED